LQKNKDNEYICGGKMMSFGFEQNGGIEGKQQLGFEQNGGNWKETIKQLVHSFIHSRSVVQTNNKLLF
jgi:hypothetical protein